MLGSLLKITFASLVFRVQISALMTSWTLQLLVLVLEQ